MPYRVVFYGATGNESQSGSMGRWTSIRGNLALPTMVTPPIELSQQNTSAVIEKRVSGILSEFEVYQRH